MRKLLKIIIVLLALKNEIQAQWDLSNGFTVNQNPELFTTNIYRQRGWGLFGEFNRSVGYNLSNSVFNRYSANAYAKYVPNGRDILATYKRRMFPGFMFGCSTNQYGGLYKSVKAIAHLGFRLEYMNGRFGSENKRTNSDFAAFGLSMAYRSDFLSSINSSELNLVDLDDPVLLESSSMRSLNIQPRINLEWSKTVRRYNTFNLAATYSPIVFKDQTFINSPLICAKIFLYTPRIDEKYLDRVCTSNMGNVYTIAYSVMDGYRVIYGQFESKLGVYKSTPKLKKQLRFWDKSGKLRTIIPLPIQLDPTMKHNKSGESYLASQGVIEEVLSSWFFQSLKWGMNVGFRSSQNFNISASVFLKWELGEYDKGDRNYRKSQSVSAGYGQSFGKFQNVSGLTSAAMEIGGESLISDCSIIGSLFLSEIEKGDDRDLELAKSLYRELYNCPCYDLYDKRKKCDEVYTEITKKVELLKTATLTIRNRDWNQSNCRLTKAGNTNFIRAENLKQWIDLCRDGVPAYCCPDWSEELGEKHGYLYNQAAVIEFQNDEDVTYRLPTKEEWNELFDLVNPQKPWPCLSLEPSSCNKTSECKQSFDLKLELSGMIFENSRKSSEEGTNDDVSTKINFEKGFQGYWYTNGEMNPAFFHFKDCALRKSPEDKGKEPMKYFGASIRMIEND